MTDRLEESWTQWRQRVAGASLRRRQVAGLILVYLGVYLLIDAHGLKHSYLLIPRNNANVAEAEALLNGRLELAERTYDTALYQGKAYNVFPPLFTLIAAAVMTVVPAGVPNSVLIVLLLLPMPGLAYALFLRRTERVRVAVLLSWGYLLGTSLLPLTDRALRNGEVWVVPHVLSQIGLLIFLLDYFGRRRIWLGGIGLIIAAWSRQLTALYLIPLAWAAVAGYQAGSRRARLLMLGLATIVLVALPATLNGLKFGSPLESGYRYIYEGRWDNADDWAAQQARRGLFSPAFVLRNLYWMNVGPPLPDSPLWLLRFVPNSYGTGIWWTTPLLLLVLVDWRRWWASPELRYLLTAAAAVFALLMLYHTTGWAQLGYNRFSMDFMVVLLAIIAPNCDGPKRKWVTFAFVLWSIWYFRWAI